VLSERQELLLRKVVEGYLEDGSPIASRALAAAPEIDWGPSTIRHELASLEELGLLAHPHTSAGRVPTDSGYRYFVDRLLPARVASAPPTLGLSLMRREVDEAMRMTTETLSRVTDLLAVVSAPPLATATVRHVEVLVLQQHLLMVVVITSTGGVTKRIFSTESPIDSGLAHWAASYLNEQLVGLGLGARMLQGRLVDATLGDSEQRFLESLAPAFTQLAETAEDALYLEGTARLLGGGDATQLEELMDMLERRVSLLGVLRTALDSRDVLVRIGSENEAPELRSMALVAAGYGLPQRNLGTVSVIGPVRMNYPVVIAAVREASLQLSRFIGEVYEDA
jgi:heat-inducible transcriptional repressor